ncbi:MAG: DNA polymerase III subunit delta [Endozoicomonas sp. (ex Botrylloides leachii)]|nr:DNA polymerase III subunit delta [Endozoicomonas sp. (ex Botrylloides leachii)]
MKIRHDQLAANLKRQLAPIYIISGDEPLQIAECADQVRKKARSGGYSERTIYHIDHSFDWREFLENINCLSLFAEKKLIELHLVNNKLNDAGKKALFEYLKTASQDNLLLLIAGKIEAQTQKTKWFKALDQVGVFIPVWPITSKQLPDWISRRLKADGFEATPDALMLLAERVDGNLLAAAQEVEKLKLLASSYKLDIAAVRQAVSDSARYDVFDLSDAALEGNIKGCMRILGILRDEGVEAAVVLWALARDIRLLSHISHLIAKGKSLDTALSESAKVIGFSPYFLKQRKPLINKAIACHSPKTLRSLLLLAGKVDMDIKGTGKNNPWNRLQTLTLSLAGLSALKY